MSKQQAPADIRNDYGSVLQSSSDLKTGAGCNIDAMPAHLRRPLDDVHPAVRERFHGCGSPLPPALDGMTVLDLGGGSGRDADLLSRLVGERGRVVGFRSITLRVCGNGSDVLAATRFAPHFRLGGDRSTHLGRFDCAPVGGGAAPANAASCC